MIKIAFFRRCRPVRQSLSPRAVLSGTVWALSVIAAAFTLTGFWVMFSNREVFYLSGLTSLITLSGVTVGGVVSGRVAGEQGWLHGMLVGLVYVLLLTCLTGFVNSRALDLLAVFFKMLPLLIAGSVGGAWGVKLPAHRSVYRRTRSPY
jgi:putative membrane protein (TIGR04086 family)